MYWFLNGRPESLVPLLLSGLLWAGGGWLLSLALFRLSSAERIAVGPAIGMALHLALANLLARLLPTAAAFAVSAVVVGGSGVALGWRHVRRPDLESLLRAWPQLLAWLLMALVITQVGRGVAILDDRKNLSLVSLLAQGNVPPPFYMDGAVPFKYHYGGLLPGAEMMALGGLMPWSALDVSKGMLGGLAILLAWHLGRRLTHRGAGGYALAAIVTFATGARWLLLLAPASWIAAASQTITLWGSGATTASRLDTALLQDWVISGGPVGGIPFAFVNGMSEPFILGMQSAAVGLSRALVLLLLLTLRRERSAWAAVVWALILALLALTWETDFLLFGGALVVVAAAGWRRRRVPGPGRSAAWAALSVLAAGVLAAVQGGTLTEVTGGLLSFDAHTAAATAGIGLRWPPAIVSAHLGLLRFDRPLELLVGLAEAGWPLLAMPAALVLLRRSARRRYELAALALGSFVAAIIPTVVEYSVDRDITRFSAYALGTWALLAVPVLFVLARRSRSWRIPTAGIAWGALTVAGGVVVFAGLLSAIGTSVFSEDIAPVDAGMTRRVWGTLEQGAWVLDSHPYRAVILTGLRTRSTRTDFSPVPEWEALVADPHPQAVLAGGYRYAYVDSDWWASMSPAVRAEYEAGCASLIARDLDSGRNPERRLYDLQACRP